LVEQPRDAEPLAKVRFAPTAEEDIDQTITTELANVASQDCS
jgi:hypothetical protein